MSSVGDTFYQYLDGNNNETTVASFFIELEEQLTKLNEDWRENMVLVMDNCGSHKT